MPILRGQLESFDGSDLPARLRSPEYRYGYGHGYARGGGGGLQAKLAVGATFGWIGDGLNAPSGGVGSGTPNPVHQFARLIAYRLQPVPLPNLCRSGSTIKTDSGSNKAFIYPYAIDAAAAQVPDVFIMGTMGANDNILSADPGADATYGNTTNTWLQDWYFAVDYAWTKFNAYGGALFVVCGTAPSTKTGEDTVDAGQTDDRRTRIWAAQQAFVEGLGAKAKFVSVSDMLPPSDYSIDGPGNLYVHYDERGAYGLGERVFAVLDPLVETLTLDEICDLIDAGTYPLQLAANSASDKALPGTGGTVTGPGITGSLATGYTITNATGATGITVGQTSTSGGRTKTVVTLAGTASGDGRILLQDSANISVTSTPGKPIRIGAICRGSAGFRNFGYEWGSAGAWGGGAAALADNTRAGANETHALASIIVNGFLTGTNGTMNYNSSTTFTGKRGLALFFKSGVSLSGTIEYERPFAYIPSNRTAAAMAYIADVSDSAGNKCLGTNYRMRPTGSISQASGGTLRVEPGQWNLFGLTEADFATRQFWKGTVSDTAVDSGTQLGSDMTGSTWTQAFAGGAVTTGDKIYVQITDRDGVKWRSVSVVTAT